MSNHLLGSKVNCSLLEVLGWLAAATFGLILMIIATHMLYPTQTTNITDINIECTTGKNTPTLDCLDPLKR